MLHWAMLSRHIWSFCDAVHAEFARKYQPLNLIYLNIIVIYGRFLRLEDFCCIDLLEAYKNMSFASFASSLEIQHCFRVLFSIFSGKLTEDISSLRCMLCQISSVQLFLLGYTPWW